MRVFRNIVWEGDAEDATKMATYLDRLAREVEAEIPPGFLFLRNLSDQFRKFVCEETKSATEGN